MARVRGNLKYKLLRQVLDGGILSKKAISMNFKISLTSGTNN